MTACIATANCSAHRRLDVHISADHHGDGHHTFPEGTVTDIDIGVDG